MDSSKISCSDTSCNKQRREFQVERRPRMLKDYLTDDSVHSCSSGGFRSFPRKPLNSSIRTLMSIDLNDVCCTNSSNSSKLLKTRSKPSTSTAISAVQIFITAVKNIQFRPVIKPPSILPRSLSRRLSKRNARKKSKNKETEIEKTTIITVKDIIRWKSFRDLLEEEKSAPADLIPSPPHCTTTATTTTTWSNITTPRSSNSSSWPDSDFTSEDYGNSEKLSEKNSPCVGEDSVGRTKATRTFVQNGQQEEEQDQHSPVSVIDFRFEECEESSSSFDETLAAVERANQKLMQKIRRFESLAKLDCDNLEDWMDDKSITDDDEEVGGRGGGKEGKEIEEKAWQLLNHVKSTTGAQWSCKDSNVDHLLVDFFSDELAAQKPEDNTGNGFDYEVVNRAKSWINGEDKLLVRWEEQCKREAYVRDMDRLGKWTLLEEEREELGLEFDNGLLGLLLDELLLDLILG